MEINMDTQLKFLHYTGLRQLDTFKDHRRKTQLYAVYTGFILSVVITHGFTMAIAAFQYLGDLQNVAMIISMVLSYIEVSFKIIDMILYKDRIDRLVSTLVEDFSGIDVLVGQEQSDILLESTQLTNKIIKLYVTAGIIAGGSWCLEPFLSKIVHMLINDGTVHERQLPFMAWFPFDAHKSPMYEIAFLFQVIAGVVGTSITVAADVLFISFMIYSACHLQMLGNSLENLRRAVLNRHRGNGIHTKRISSSWQETALRTSTEHYFTLDNIFGESTLEQVPGQVVDSNLDKQLAEELKKCIQHHQSILGFISDLEKIISPVMLFQFLATTLEICLAGFQAKLGSSLHPSFFKFVLYTTANIIQTFCYCKFGDNITVESMNFATSSYNSEWYEGSEKFKRTVRILLLRSHRPIILWAGSFYTVTLKTFANLMNHAYSFFTLLSQIDE
ncbi:odorant receptor 82a isoform X2 [Anabrus simplex]